ncbi:hypothetical protein KKG90_11570 [Candidatus Bipolaricaulota bacterium]|nr:hypothetical protein [Candidatus Bipolaricaulota bacterium]
MKVRNLADEIGVEFHAIAVRKKFRLPRCLGRQAGTDLLVLLNRADLPVPVR